ncbi:3-methyl-2-oxobutanoate hydroxymethyltransferase [Streptomyces sp. NPDC055134]
MIGRGNGASRPVIVFGGPGHDGSDHEQERGEKWAMLTAHDMLPAATFDEAGIPVLLIGDSASNNVFGHKTSLPVTVDELLPPVRAVSGAARRALVVADLPFGSSEASAEQCFHTAVRFMKEAGAHAVKLEGGEEMAGQVELRPGPGSR